MINRKNCFIFALFLSLNAFAALILKVNPMNWVIPHRNSSSAASSSELNAHEVAARLKTFVEDLRKRRNSISCSFKGEEGQALLAFGNCNLNPAQVDRIKLSKLGECFESLPAAIEKISNLECRRQLDQIAESLLNYLVAVQLEPQLDSVFKEQNRADSSSLLGELTIHLEWMSAWRNLRYESSKQASYFDDLFIQWLNKVTRILQREGVMPQSLESKVQLATQMLELVPRSRRPVHDDFVVKLVLTTLEMFEERLNLWQRIHNIACEFAACEHSVRSPDLAALIWGFGHIGEENSIPSRAIQDSSPSVQAFVRALNGIRIPENGSEYLQSKVAPFKAMSEIYERVGYFQHPAETLVSGLNDRSIRYSIEQLAQFPTVVARESGNIHSARASLFNALMNEGHHASKKAEIESELRRKTKELGYVLDQLNGTQRSLQVAEAQLGTRAQALLKDLEQTRFREHFENDQPMIHQLVIHPNAVPHGGQVFVPGFLFPVGKGNLVQLTVNQDWAPSCAVKKEYPLNPNVGGKTGPEGYMLTTREGREHVVQVQKYETKSQYENTDDTHSVCNGWNKSKGKSSGLFASLAGNLAGGALGMALHSSTSGSSVILGSVLGNVGNLVGSTQEQMVSNSSDQKCHSISKGNGRESGSTNGILDSQDSTLQAAFQAGLRSSFAPLSNFPAGSLLLVYETGINENRKQSIQVVQRNHRFIVPEDGTLRFIVNDCSGSTETDPGQLAVDLRILQPRSELVKGLIHSLSLSLEKLREKASTYAGMGEMGPEQWSELESSVFEELARNSRSNGQGMISEIEREFSSFIRHWINSEVAQVGRKLRIIKLLKQGEILADQVADLEAAIHRLRNDDRLIHAPLYWAEFNFDLSQKAEIQIIQNFLTLFEARISPMVRILYPSIRNQLINDATQFPQLGVRNENSEIVQSLARLAEAIYNKLTENQADEMRELRRVAFRFQNPDQEYSSLGVTPAHFNTSEAVWNAIKGREQGTVTIRVTPDLVYKGSSNCTALNLDNFQYASVVESLGLVFQLEVNHDIPPGEQYSLLRLDNVLVPGSQVFVFDSGTKTFELKDQNLNSIGIPVFKINRYPQLNTLFEISGASGSGRGISPYGDFKVPAEYLRYLAVETTEGRLEQIKEIYWLMDLKSTKGFRSVPISVVSESSSTGAL